MFNDQLDTYAVAQPIVIDVVLLSY